MAMAAPYRCSLPCPEHESGRGLPLCCRGGDDLNMLQLQRVLGTQYTSTAQQAVMQAKKVLDGSKHEYSTAVQQCTEARTPTAITLCLSIYPYYAVYATNEQASVRVCGWVSTSVPSVRGPVVELGRRLESSGRGGAGLGRAAPCAQAAAHGRAEKKPKCKPLGGEQQQQRPAESSRSQMLYAVLATRRPSRTHQHTCYTQRCFSELLDNINNSSITCNTTTTTAALQLRCGDIRRQELSCAGQRCILSDGDPAVERQ